MSTPAVTLDLSQSRSLSNTPAESLAGAVNYATQQDPAAYAKLLDLQKRTGIPPVAAQGNEKQVQQTAQANSLDPHAFTVANPRTATWASNPDNAAVAGVDELHRLGGIEQNAFSLRNFHNPLPEMFGNAWDTVKDVLGHPLETLLGADTPQVAAQKQEMVRNLAKVTGNQFLNSVVKMQDASEKPLLSVSGTQRFQRILDPNSRNVFSRAATGAVKGIEGLSSPSNIGLLATTAIVPEDAGSLVSGVFGAQMAQGSVEAGGQAVQQATQGNYGNAAELAAGSAMNALFAAGSVKHTLLGGVDADLRQSATSPGENGFHAQLDKAVDATAESELRKRSPDSFQSAMEHVFAGDESLRIPADRFAEQFGQQNVHAVADSLGVTNYAEALLSGGDVEVPRANFFGKLEPEQQKMLVPDIVDPATGMTVRQAEESKQQLQEWLTGGGIEKLQAETAQADAETAASPEYQAVREQLRQRYVDAGEQPDVADTLADKDANVYANLARQVGMKPDELLRMYNPKVVAADAPASPVLYQSAPDTEAFKRWFGESKVVDESGNPQVVYHGTNDKFTKINFRKGAQGLFWFASDRQSIESGDAGAQGTKNIMPLYAKIENPAGWAEYDKYSADELAARGYDGVILPEKDGSFVGFIFKDAAQVKSADRNRGTFDATDKSILHQEAPEGTRGWFRVQPDGSYEIGKTKIGDLSTFVHEPAHGYLTIVADLASRKNASDLLKQDYAKIREFLGADSDNFTREQQEKWARANEQYLREGRTPSAALKGVFQRFALWLGNIYRKASDLGVELNDDIRGVFDRMYAAEEGVDRAAAETGQRLFTTPEEAGWTDEQFAAYADQNNVSVEQAKSHILGLLNEAAVRERSQAWREEESNVRTAITADIDQRPEYAAIRALRKGALDDGTALSLNKDALVKQFGKERVAELQKQHPGLYRNEGGFDPETAAEILGFDSAQSMVDSIKNAPRRSAAIEQETRAYMTEKHGDIRYDGSLMDQARLAVENDKRSDALYRELSALKRKLADTKSAARDQKQAARDIAIAPIAAYREAARQAIEGKAVADVQPTRYLDASRKYSREAFDALRKGDTQEAADAKHKELLNHFLFREASAAKDYIGKFEAYAKRVQGKSVQGKLGLAGTEYRNHFNQLLARYGLGESSGQPERSLAQWTTDLFNEGKEPAIDPAMLNDTRRMSYRNTPIGEVRLLHDAVVNIRKLASLELGMTVNGRKMEFATAVDRMVTRAQESLKSNPRPVLDDNRTSADKAGDLLNRGGALLARTEFTIKRLDGGMSGPWRDYLFNLAADSQGRESELHHQVTKSVGDALEHMPVEQRKMLLNKVSIEGIAEPVTRRSMIGMALNMGNEGNLDRLQRTFEAHGWDAAAVDKVKGALSREEWQFVQGIWDSLKPLGQQQFELERRLTGLPPVMVKATPMRLEFGESEPLELDGGYYPIVMDSRFSARGATQDAGTTAQNIMEGGYGRAATSRGSMKERTGFGGPLKLDYEQVLTQHTAKVVKDISHREFMLAANKLLLNQDIRRVLQETAGEDVEKQMLPWLRTIINDSNGTSQQGLAPVERGINKLRTNVVKAALGLKFSTTLLQLTHASSVFLHTSPRSYAQAMVDFMAHPNDMTEQIRGMSPNEMRFRGENIDRDMREIMRKGIDGKSVSDVWATLGMAPVKFMDHVLSFPLWLSAYRDALEKHVDLPQEEAEYQAQHAADAAVRMGLGANAPKDLPPIMRNNGLTKLLTTMGGFHNLKWNQISDQVSTYRNGGGAGQLSYGVLMAALIPAVMGPLITGHGPKDDESSGWWAAKRALLFPAETISILNIAVEALERGGDVSVSPIIGAVERGAKAGVRAGSDKADKDWVSIEMDGMQSAMDLYGVSGTDQIFKTGRYVRKASRGEVANPNVRDAIFGEAPKK